MVSRIFACLDTLIDLALSPGWNGDYDDFDQRNAGTAQLRELIDSDRVILYIPPVLVANIHLAVQTYAGVAEASQVIERLLEMGNTALGIDYERVLEQANKLFGRQMELTLYEAVLLVAAAALKADAIVVRAPTLFSAAVYPHRQSWFEFDIPILGVKDIQELESFLSRPTHANGNWIYAFTPQGRVIRLPYGATPVDFAYRVHTKIGNRCTAARVNGSEVPLDQALRHHDVVEIVKGQTSQPNPEWLSFVVTRTAKKAIQRGLRNLWSQRGWVIANEVLSKNGRIRRHQLEWASRELQCSTQELILKLGADEIPIEKIQTLVQQGCYWQVEEKVLSAEGKSATRQQPSGWWLASCCHPLPGDPIVGVLGGQNRPIRVHCATCDNLQRVPASRCCQVTWECQQCDIQLLVVMQDQPDIVRPVLNRLVEYDMTPNLRSLNIAPDGTVRTAISLEISSRRDLNRTLQQIEAMPQVMQVKVTKLSPVEHPKVPPFSLTPRFSQPAST
ncbi:MAG: bifunctional (p)ppGpp synthetase/guanosine-3',5'-bis(diphosphate) 3'-pyrophosphohydrolase [Leptolyngbya sp. SIO4C1]|nr:bifunctional (p)ppGpp synthetase/guanosine-3',5'-bis(diphosphate) 3'-pyrophosphohydrolase [Leptolyngbya sp. SIO4C1]